MLKLLSKKRSKSTPHESSPKENVIKANSLKRQRPARPESPTQFEEVIDHPLVVDDGNEEAVAGGLDSFWMDSDFTLSANTSANPSAVNSVFNSLERRQTRPSSRASNKLMRFEEACQKLEQIRIDQQLIQQDQSRLNTLKSFNQALKKEIETLQGEVNSRKESEEKLWSGYQGLRRDLERCVEEKKQLMRQCDMIKDIKGMLHTQMSTLGHIEEQTQRIEDWVSGVDQRRDGISLRKAQLKPWALEELKKIKISLTIPGMNYKRDLSEILGMESSSSKNHCLKGLQKAQVEKVLLNYLTSKEYNKTTLQKALIETGLARIVIPLSEEQLLDWNKAKADALSALAEIGKTDLIINMFKCDIISRCEMSFLLSEPTAEQLVEAISSLGLPAVSTLLYVVDIYGFTALVTQLKVILGVDERDSTRAEAGSVQGDAVSLHELASTFEVEQPTADDVNENQSLQADTLVADENQTGGDEQVFSLNVNSNQEQISESGFDSTTKSKKKGKKKIPCLCGSKVSS